MPRPSLFLWYGGKGRMVSNLLKYIPKYFTYYCEMFFGGGALFFALPKIAEFEVINDINKDLMNFYRVLRDPNKFEKFRFLVELTPYSRSEYYVAREKYRNREWKDDIERAYLFFIIARMSFSGNFAQSWSFGTTAISRSLPRCVSAYISCLDKLEDFHCRIMAAQIECSSFERIFESYISRWEYDKSFCYLDPPYIRSSRREGSRSVYNHEMTGEQHKLLVDLLLEHNDRCKFMLSGYDNELYQKLEDFGWKKICWDIGCHAVAKTKLSGVLGKDATFKKNQRRKECIWINYDPRG